MLETVLKALIALIAPDVRNLERRSLPTGGSTGQVLRKKSNANHDAEWATMAGGASTVGSQSVWGLDEVGFMPLAGSPNPYLGMTTSQSGTGFTATFTPAADSGMVGSGARTLTLPASSAAGNCTTSLFSTGGWIALGLKRVVFMSRFRLNTLMSSATPGNMLFCGFVTGAPATSPTSGCYFFVRWQASAFVATCVTGQSVSLRTETPITITEATFYDVKIIVADDRSSVEFWLNETLVATHTTNIPTTTQLAAPVAYGIRPAAASTVVQTIVVSYIWAYQTD